MADSAADTLKTGQILAIGATVLAGVGLVGLLAMNTPQNGTPVGDATAPIADQPAPTLLPADLWSAEFAVPEIARTTASGALGRGETLSDLVISLGATPADAHTALAPLFEAEFIDPRRVLPGLTASATLREDGDGPARLTGLTVRTAPDHSFIVTRTDDGDFAAARMDARLTPTHLRVAGTVSTSLYMAAIEDGAGDQQVVDFAKIFAYDVDFQREIHPGDRFEIVYESLVDERGNPVRLGNVVYAELDGRAIQRAFYHHVPSDDGVEDYFDAGGDSATKFLMKTPINGARLSSHFGNRRHPISGYTRLHKGTDFAAPTGTPVYAAGHGTIERASRYGGYGHYVRIRHANGYKTAYAHLSRYGSGIRSGRSVRQGDVIGYVGSTGASTGPHLHYEVMINGRHVNAMNLNFPTGRKLSEDEAMFEEFLARKGEIDAIRQSLGAEVTIATATSTDSTDS